MVSANKCDFQCFDTSFEFDSIFWMWLSLLYGHAMDLLWTRMDSSDRESWCGWKKSEMTYNTIMNHCLDYYYSWNLKQSLTLLELFNDLFGFHVSLLERIQTFQNDILVWLIHIYQLYKFWTKKWPIPRCLNNNMWHIQYRFSQCITREIHLYMPYLNPDWSCDDLCLIRSRAFYWTSIFLNSILPISAFLSFINSNIISKPWFMQVRTL